MPAHAEKLFARDIGSRCYAQTAKVVQTLNATVERAATVRLAPKHKSSVESHHYRLLDAEGVPTQTTRR